MSGRACPSCHADLVGNDPHETGCPIAARERFFLIRQRGTSEEIRAAAAAWRQAIIDYGKRTGKRVPVPTVAKLMRQ